MKYKIFVRERFGPDDILDFAYSGEEHDNKRDAIIELAQAARLNRVIHGSIYEWDEDERYGTTLLSF